MNVFLCGANAVKKTSRLLDELHSSRFRGPTSLDRRQGKVRPHDKNVAYLNKRTLPDIIIIRHYHLKASEVCGTSGRSYFRVLVVITWYPRQTHVQSGPKRRAKCCFIHLASRLKLENFRFRKVHVSLPASISCQEEHIPLCSDQRRFPNLLAGESFACASAGARAKSVMLGMLVMWRLEFFSNCFIYAFLEQRRLPK